MNTSNLVLRRSALCLLALLATSSAVAQTSSLYGLSFFDNQLLLINPTTGAGSLVAPLSESVAPYGLAFRGNQLYTFDSNSDRIRGINRSTGMLTSSIDIGVGDLLGEGDLAFRSDGTGFLASALTPDFGIANDLFRFDLDAGTSVRIGTTAVVLDGMAFIGNTLYAIGQEAAPKLYIVDQDTAVLTNIGLLGIPMNSPFGALAAASNAELYASIDDRLYMINRSTGTASMLDPDVWDFGFNSVAGLAFSTIPDTFTPIPEPSTYGLAGVATLMAISILRRRRSQQKAVPTA